jgi:hypothetical protein
MFSDAPITRVGTNIYAPPEHSPLAKENGKCAGRAAYSVADVLFAREIDLYASYVRGPRSYANHPITDLPITSRDEEWADELKRVLAKATDDDPAMRHQSVEELWADLEGIRRIAADGEVATQVRSKLHALPQAMLRAVILRSRRKSRSLTLRAISGVVIRLSQNAQRRLAVPQSFRLLTGRRMPDGTRRGPLAECGAAGHRER